MNTIQNYDITNYSQSFKSQRKILAACSKKRIGTFPSEREKVLMNVTGKILAGTSAVLSLFLYTIMTICKPKEEKIRDKISDLHLNMEDAYVWIDRRTYDDFKKDIRNMNKFVDKYSKNEEYSQFVKDATSFLLVNYEKSHSCNDTNKRFEPFSKDYTYSQCSELNARLFIDVIASVANGAISNDLSNKADLDKKIQWARKFM